MKDSQRQHNSFENQGQHMPNCRQMAPTCNLLIEKAAYYSAHESSSYTVKGPLSGGALSPAV